LAGFLRRPLRLFGRGLSALGVGGAGDDLAPGAGVCAEVGGGVRGGDRFHLGVLVGAAGFVLFAAQGVELGGEVAPPPDAAPRETGELPGDRAHAVVDVPDGRRGVSLGVDCGLRGADRSEPAGQLCVVGGHRRRGGLGLWWCPVCDVGTGVGKPAPEAGDGGVEVVVGAQPDRVGPHLLYQFRPARARLHVRETHL